MITGSFLFDIEIRYIFALENKVNILLVTNMKVK